MNVLAFAQARWKKAIGRRGLIRMAKRIAKRYPESLLHQVQELDVKDISEAAVRRCCGACVSGACRNVALDWGCAPCLPFWICAL